MAVINVPFEVGAEYWLPVAHPRQVSVLCPVCAGQLAIEIVLGTGERVGVPCEGCAPGMGTPQGQIQQWTHEPDAVSFVIAKADGYHGDEWSVRSESGASCRFAELYTTREEAFRVAEAQAAANHERNMETHQYKRTGAKKAGWTVFYHRQKIADLQQQIAWHESRINAKAKGR